MRFLRDKIFSTPWRLIVFFLPVAAVAAGVGYWMTLVRYVFPGEVSITTARAVGLCAAPDLTNPIFHQVMRFVADIRLWSLPMRLNAFSGACSAAAVSLFYLMVTRLVFGFSVEDAGGAMRAFPQFEHEGDEGDTPPPVFSVDIPWAVQIHNTQTTVASILGGMCAAVALAFCPPFWIAATRVMPFGFDLMVFFLIINLLIAYDQGGKDVSLFLGILLTSYFSIESPLFLLLFPIAAIVLFRSLILNEEANTFRVLGMLLLGIAGSVAACFTLWVSAQALQFPPAGNKALFWMFLETVRVSVLGWIPNYGWSYSIVLFLLPSALALFVVFHSFARRTVWTFLLQLLLAAILVPNLLNLDYSLWGVDRHAGKLPIYSYVLLSLYIGFLISIWYLMRECKILRKGEEQGLREEDDEPDFYEVQDNHIVAHIGSWLCWPLVLVVLAVPYRSFIDVNPKSGEFSDKLVTDICASLNDGDWLVNTHWFQYPLRLRGYLDGKHFFSIPASSDPDRCSTSPELPAEIKRDPIFTNNWAKLVNMADVSNASFLHEWMLGDTNAYRKIALFSDSALLSKNGYEIEPAGFFMRGVPSGTKIDSLALLNEHKKFTEQIRPLVLTEKPDRDKLFRQTRRISAGQLALIGNELGCLLVRQGHAPEAAELFKKMQEFDSSNLSLLLNRYQLAVFSKVDMETLPQIETVLRDLPKRINTFQISGDIIAQDYGTLLNRDVLAHVRRNLWIRGSSFRGLIISTPSRNTSPLAALHDKRQELYQVVTKYLDANEYDAAERALDILLDFDEKDPFVMVNKARIAIQQNNLPEAGVWIDLAKENGIPESELLWQEASMLYLGGKKDEAKAFINKHLPDRTDDTYLLGVLARILLDEGRFDELDSRIYPALRNATSRKEHYIYHWVRGHLLEHEGKDSTARVAFRRALQLNPHLADVREEILRIDDRLGVPAFCEDDAKDMLRVAPDHALSNYLLGMVRLHEGALDLAEDLFTRSIAKNRSAAALAGLGAVLLERGQVAKANELLAESMKLDANRPFTHHELAKLYLQTNHLRQAEVEINWVLEKTPQDLDAQLTRIRILIKQGRKEEAAVLVSKLDEVSDQYAPAYQHEIQKLGEQLIKELDL